MRVATVEDIENIVHSDSWMMDVLGTAEELNLPDWWIGAGFLRNKVWDTIEDNEFVPTKDVDLVYFNSLDTAPETDWAYDELLKKNYPIAEWEVRNQARMHYINDFTPFVSTADGISHWVETATCVAVKLENKKLKFVFCHGLEDLLGLIARPSPCIRGTELMDLFFERIEKKKWQQKWPHLKVLAN